MNFVPCLAWVPKGKAASTPQKLQLSPEELKRLVDETKELCDKNNSADESEDSDEADQDGNEETAEECSKDEGEVEQGEENDDFESRYNLDSYDNDDDQNPLFTINDLAVHVDNKDDEYLSDQESEGDLEEKEDFTIKDSDNLLVVGHVEDSSSVLEVHVYNEEDDAFYVHHDIVLPSYPLALAWLDFHPSEENPGNYVAVGDMSPVIKIWDLDVVDVLEPDYTLGKISKKKEKVTKETEMRCHSDAVLSLSWNKQVRNLLASGSADSTVIVWDLEERTCLNQLSYHSNKVQALEWHPTESQFLLSGCTDGFLKLYDCRSDGETKSWKVDGEIEKVVWNFNDSFKFFCSTDKGYIHLVDIRSDKIENSFQPHKEAITGLDISPLRPDVLISASMDRTLKVWDIKNFKMLKSLKLKVGSIYAAKVAPDHELAVAAGGNNASNSLKILNIFTDNKNVESKDENETQNMKKESEFQGNTVLNKKDAYKDMKSDDMHKNINIKKEKELQGNTKLNKRKTYNDGESSDFHESIIVKENVLQGETKLNKRKIYYDTEEKDEINLQTSSNHNQQKDFKRKK